MGANMARRVNDQHFTITAISDVNTEAAKSLAGDVIDGAYGYQLGAVAFKPT